MGLHSEVGTQTRTRKREHKHEHEHKEEHGLAGALRIGRGDERRGEERRGEEERRGGAVRGDVRQRQRLGLRLGQRRVPGDAWRAATRRASRSRRRGSIAPPAAGTRRACASACSSAAPHLLECSPARRVPVNGLSIECAE